MAMHPAQVVSWQSRIFGLAQFRVRFVLIEPNNAPLEATLFSGRLQALLALAAALLAVGTFFLALADRPGIMATPAAERQSALQQKVDVPASSRPARAAVPRTLNAPDTGNFPLGPAHDVTSTLGSFAILVHPRYRPLMAGYPGYSGDTGDPATSYILQLPPLFSYSTTIGRSAVLTDSSSLDALGVPVGEAGTVISDSSMILPPAGFAVQPGTRELHTEIASLALYYGNISMIAGSLNNAPISPGEIQSLSGSGNPAADYPAHSFFDLFTELILPPGGGFIGAKLVSLDPVLLVTDTLSTWPEKSLFVERNNTAVPLAFLSSTQVMIDGQEVITASYRAGDTFGWLISGGIGVGYTNDPADLEEFQARLQFAQALPVACNDLDGNGQVDVGDVQAETAAWHQAAGDADYNNLYDQDQDGRTTVADIMLAALQRGQNCRPASLQPGTVVINEIMPVAASGQSPWVELLNRGTGPLPLRGAMLDDGDGHTYILPANLPDVPAGDLVVVIFDGSGNGADDVDFGDGKAVLHTPGGLVNPFAAAGDQLALYRSNSARPDTLLDFVAWGQPAGTEDDLAVAAGLWPDDTYIASERGGVISGASQPGESMGLYPGRPRGQLDSYVVYASYETSQGQANRVPGPEVVLPPAGSFVLRQSFDLTWYNVTRAARYRLQMDNNSNFSSPEVDVVLDAPYYAPAQPPADGTYYWRTKTTDLDGQESDFSPAVTITIATATPFPMPTDAAPSFSALLAYPQVRDPAFLGQLAATSQPVAVSGATAALASQSDPWITDAINGLPPILQRKDTNLLCWDGDDESGARQPWDGPHQDTPGNHSIHGRMNCVRASVAMINAKYGGNLSQDRLSYEVFKDNWPAGDLGHDKGTPDNSGAGVHSVEYLLSWALNNASAPRTAGKPTFPQIQTLIAQGRPILAEIPGHAVVIRGWLIYNGPSGGAVTPGQRMLLYNDPWDAKTKSVSYDSFPIQVTWVAQGTPTARMQEASVTQDSDGDGIMDFDETNRFGTNPNNMDTDGDGIPDKLDMHSYLYYPHNTYIGSAGAYDVDGDKLRTELDKDSDNGGATDGQEDKNKNGHYDKTNCETINFNPNDDRKALAGGSSPPGGPMTLWGALALSQAYCTLCTVNIYRYDTYYEIHYGSCECNPSFSCRPWICSYAGGGCSEYS